AVRAVVAAGVAARGGAGRIAGLAHALVHDSISAQAERAVVVAIVVIDAVAVVALFGFVLLLDSVAAEGALGAAEVSLVSGRRAWRITGLLLAWIDLSVATRFMRGRHSIGDLSAADVRTGE